MIWGVNIAFWAFVKMKYIHLCTVHAKLHIHFMHNRTIAIRKIILILVQKLDSANKIQWKWKKLKFIQGNLTEKKSHACQSINDVGRIIRHLLWNRYRNSQTKFVLLLYILHRCDTYLIFLFCYIQIIRRESIAIA